MSDDEARMSFTEHLGELRIRIIHTGVALLVAVVVCYAFSDQLFDTITRPLQQKTEDGQGSTDDNTVPNDTGNDAGPDEKEPEANFFYFNILEPILVKVKLAGYGGLLLTLPYITWQICAFVFPGLKPNEKKVMRILIFGCGLLAILGVCVAYFGIFPVVLIYIQEFAPPGVIGQLRMNENVSIIIKGLVGFAIAFQFPMAVLILVYMELLTPETLKRYRRVAIVGMAIAAAFFTPPDPLTMAIMLVPLVLLYEGSIWMSYIVLWRKKKTAKAAS